MSIPNPSFVAGTTIASGQINANFSTITDEITNSIAADGQTTPTANLPMGGWKLTGLGSSTAATDSVHLRDVQYQAWAWCGTAGGTANAITLSPAPAVGAYAAGQVFRWKAGATPNTGAMTVDISSLGTIAIQNNGAALVGGEHAANGFYEGVLDTTSTMQLRQISGNFIGIDAQTQGAVLDDLNTLGAASADGEVIVATGAGAFAYESGATLRTSVGVGTGDSPQFAGLNIESTDSSAGEGPVATIYRNSPDPAASDLIGVLEFAGEDSLGNKETYAKLRPTIFDPTSGSETGALQFFTVRGGTLAERFRVGNGILTAAAVGGDKGADTVNASNYFKDGVQLITTFESAEQTISNGGTFTVTHGLGGRPSYIETWVRCKTTEHNWAVDEEVQIHPGATDASSDFGIAIGLTNTTEIFARYGALNTPIRVMNKTTGIGAAVTNANWRVFIRAGRFV